MHCWPRYVLWTLIAVVSLGNMLTACGQKGDLYLPDEDQQQEEEERRNDQGKEPPVTQDSDYDI